MTKKQGLFFMLLCLLATSVRAQYNLPQSRIWAMGNLVGLDFTMPGNPVPISTALANGNEAAASICDTAGHLLFYTNGTTVWTSTGVAMPNGTGLTGAGGSTLSTTQGAVIMPVPDSAGKYYLFSLTAVSNCKLYCNKIDMSLNGGLGDVVTTYPLRGVSIADTFLTEKMTCARGCNNTLWLVVHTQNSGTFKAFHVMDTGINLTPVLSTFSLFGIANYAQGVMKFSPDGNHMLNCNFRTSAPLNAGVELYDFDRTTGVLSNGITLDSGSHYGGTFSPDGTKVYATSNVTSKVFQWDLTAATPSLSKVQLGPCGQYVDLKLAPDGKIYFGALVGSPGYSNYRYMGRVNAPDNAGSACLFQDSVTSIIFPAATGTYGRLCQGLPNDVVVPVPAINQYFRTLDTVVCSPLSAYTLTAPGGYTSRMWDDATTGISRTVSTRGTYWVTSISMCDTRVDTFVIGGADMPALAITNTAHLLTATAGFSSYTWYKDGVVIPAATTNTYTAIANGVYSVHGNFTTGCSDSTSYAVTDIIDHTGVNTVGNTHNISIYPNPATNTLYIGYTEPVNIAITGMDGKTIFTATNTLQANISNIADGLYMVTITNSQHERLATQKLVKTAR